MTRIIGAIACLLVLTGCVTTREEPPQKPTVTVQGPRFATAQFDCGQEPLPPHPEKATGKTGALYVTKLGGWGRTCSGKLKAVASELEAAGQIVTAP